MGAEEKRLLDKLAGPEDLRRLAPGDLARLAAEIREEFARVIPETGGHFASNFGTVELTLALHYTHDFSRDRLIWDVGHQAYAHKLLTGRREAFRRLRTAEGLSGFPNPRESPYDPFFEGHAGTAVSQALGLSAGSHLRGEERRVVAVIGDGAATSGMTFEALNHAGELNRDLTVVLNDNGLFISRPVGGLSRTLNRLRLAPAYRGLKDELHQILGGFPRLGPALEKALEHAREFLRRGILSHSIFEDLGWSGFGPFDGHDLPGLIGLFQEIRGLKGPVLVHLVTRKGHGHPAAEQDPVRYYSFPPRQEAELRPGESYSKAFGRLIRERALKDERVVAVTPAMMEGTTLSALHRELPQRVFDVGIAEQHALGLAEGLAAAGLKPVVAIYSTFLQRAFDQVFQELCLQGSPVLLVLDRAGLSGEDGPTHHGAFDIACLRPLPGLVLMAPRDGETLAGMLDLGLARAGPSVIRVPKAEVPAALAAAEPRPLAPGTAEVLRRGRGAHGAIVAYGACVAEAATALSLLGERGLNPTLVDARFAKPLDEALLRELAANHRFLLTVEEGALAGGFGAAVAELFAAGGGPAGGVHRLGLPDRFLGHGRRKDLLAELGLDAAGVARAVEGLAGKKK